MRQAALCGGAFLLAALAGCAPSATLPQPSASPRPVQALPGGAQHAAPAGPSECFLTPEDVQRQAAGSSGVAAALEREGSGPAPSCSLCAGGHSHEAEELSRTLRHYAADEARNQQASQALQTYYQLAEARGQSAFLLQGRQVVEDLIRQANELEKKGFETPAQLPSLLRQRSELASDAVKLSLADEQLQEKLRMLCGFPPGTCAAIRTVDTFQVLDEALDEEQVVAYGLARRPDLALLRTAAQQASAGTLAPLRGLLSAANGLLGQSSHPCLPLLDCLCLLLSSSGKEEVEKVRQQLGLLLAERQRQAAAEIRAAVHEVRARVQLTRLAGQREELAQQQVRELEEKERKGFKVSADLPQARRDLFKARSDTLREAIAWEVARVKLRQALGLLVLSGVRGQESGVSH